jgi:hypothetical protein
MKREIPRDAQGRRLCEHCMETPVPAALGTKPKRYCSRNCRQRAYEARKQARTIREAVAFAVDLDRQARERGTSRDGPTLAAGTSRDDAESEENPQVQAPGTSRDDAKPRRKAGRTRGSRQQLLFPPGHFPPAADDS